MTLIKSLIAGAAITFSSISFSDVSTWELEAQDKDKNIKVFTRTVGDSPLKEFKGVTQMKSSVSSFVALLSDAEAATKWMHNVAEFSVHESPSQTENLVYTVNSTPWPVTDRDAYIRSVMTANKDGSVVSSLKAEPAYKENNDDYIRMPELSGSWTFTPMDNGIVEVIYQVHANPGGSLPDWLVNAIVVETPLETLSNLHEIISEEKYQNHTFAFIEQAISGEAVETVSNVNSVAAE